MNTSDEDEFDQLAQAAKERVRQIHDLFRQMRSVLHVWLTDQDDPTPTTTKQMLNKISEMQTVHVLVLKAEEAFRERTKSDNLEDVIVDLDEIRAEIGRKLDSLRDAIAESSVS